MEHTNTITRSLADVQKLLGHLMNEIDVLKASDHINGGDKTKTTPKKRRRANMSNAPRKSVLDAMNNLKVFTTQNTDEELELKKAEFRSEPGLETPMQIKSDDVGNLSSDDLNVQSMTTVMSDMSQRNSLLTTEEPSPELDAKAHSRIPGNHYDAHHRHFISNIAQDDIILSSHFSSKVFDNDYEMSPPPFQPARISVSTDNLGPFGFSDYFDDSNPKYRNQMYVE